VATIGPRLARSLEERLEGATDAVRLVVDHEAQAAALPVGERLCPVTDLALVSSVQALKRLARRPSRDQLVAMAEPWRP
jgi:hypothetical protein